MLNDYIGQQRIKENLKVFISSAKKRNATLEHILFYGPDGVGKETLAHAIANEIGVNIVSISATKIFKGLDFSAMLTKLEKGDILFIDEIHRLNRNIEEILYPAMEDFTLDMVAGAGAMKSSLRLYLKNFTLIGSTTKEELVPKHLCERFSMKFRLTYYDDSEMLSFVQRYADDMALSLREDVAAEVAKHCEGVPINAMHLLKRIRDFAEFEDINVIDLCTTRKALKNICIDEICPYMFGANTDNSI